MNLTDDAMQVSLRITAWSGRLYDRQASNHVAVHHDAAASAGRYNKCLHGAGECAPGIVHGLRHRGMTRQLGPLGLPPVVEIGQHRRTQLLAHGGRSPADLPLIPRSMSNSTSIRCTTSSASGEICGAVLPRRLLAAMSASS